MRSENIDVASKNKRLVTINQWTAILQWQDDTNGRINEGPWTHHMHQIGNIWDGKRWNRKIDGHIDGVD
jgi:hypothetical protein